MRKSKKRNRIHPIAAVVIALAAALLVAVGVTVGGGRYMKASYPQEYSQYVEKYAAEYGLDKFTVYAFIRTESGFEPTSESYLGARGLMQIMPETFDWIKYRLDDDLTYDDMYVPEHNIRYGCYLLSWLSERYGGRLTEVAASYHAGSGSVDSWLENPQYCTNGTLCVIPVSDTAHYVDKITSAYDTYCRLYKDNK